MRGRRPYIPHRHPELLGRPRLWEGGGDDMDFPIVVSFSSPGRQYRPPSYLNVTLEVGDDVYTIYEDPDEECLVIDPPLGAIGLEALEALVGSRTISCQCGATFASLAAALEHAAGEKHRLLTVR